MIKNTEVFFRKAKEYQDKRSQIVTDYEASVKKLEPYRGSEGYLKDIEGLKKKLDDDLMCWVYVTTSDPERTPEYYEKLFS